MMRRGDEAAEGRRGGGEARGSIRVIMVMLIISNKRQRSLVGCEEPRNHRHSLDALGALTGSLARRISSS